MTEREFNDIHEQIFSLLPWYINQTLSPEEDQSVESHLTSCLVCRNELKHQKSLRQAVIQDDDNEAAFNRSLQSLHEKINADLGVSGNVSWLHRFKKSVDIVRKSHAGIQTALAAQAAVIVLAVGFLMVNSFQTSTTYQTLTSPANMDIHSKYNVIFAEDLTVIGMQTLLEDNGLSIHAGPSPAGAYILSESNQGKNSTDVLQALKNHPKIRFATPLK